MHRDGHLRIGQTLAILSVLVSASELAAGDARRVKAVALRPLSVSDARVAEFARQGAIMRLRSPQCRQVLSDFRDGEGLARAVPAAARGPLVQNLTLPGNPDVILQIDPGNRWTRLAIHAAIGGAFRRLASPACGQIFSDFTDGNGRTLQENLEATGQSAQNYLGLLRYADGAGQAPCAREGIMAFTYRGLRIIYVCGVFRDRFLTLRLRARADLEVYLLHEVLHTLGLGENPPTPQQITDQVRLRCDNR